MFYFLSEAKNQRLSCNFRGKSSHIKSRSSFCAETDKASEQKAHRQAGEGLDEWKPGCRVIQVVAFHASVCLVFLGEIVLTVLPLHHSALPNREPRFPSAIPLLLLFLFYAPLKTPSRSAPDVAVVVVGLDEGSSRSAGDDSPEGGGGSVGGGDRQQRRTGLHRGDKLRLQQQEQTFDLKSHFVFAISSPGHIFLFFSQFVHYLHQCFTALFLFDQKKQIQAEVSQFTAGLNEM